ncbi:MAG: glycoside hydrolase family 2 TIM barrel-domain containing protein [Woeseiaceae bacterium]
MKVEVVQTERGFQLHRGGAPYFIKGAGLEFGDIESLAAHGGNSIRNWTTRNDVETAQEVLDKAEALGVTVALCLPMQADRWDFDYGDAEAVAAQLDAFRQEVIKYRDHPALLIWIIGNELNFDYTNPNVYDAVNDVSKMIHELDPNHPTTTTVVGVGEDVISEIRTRAPDLDFMSFQVYGELFVLPDLIDEVGLDGPFMVTEWGAIGHWEVDKTSWGAPIEATSSEKADTYRRGYRQKLEPLDGQLIGSYAFIWGQKQERTPTWFGLFTEAGEETETVDVMHQIWNDKWPENRAPQIRSIQLDGKVARDNVILGAGESYVATADIFDSDGDVLSYKWELKPESDTTQVGGDYEEPIASLDGLIDKPIIARTLIVAPEPGAYRLFVYAYDGQGHAAHANIPFLVRR